VEKIVVTVALKAELFLCRVLCRKKSLMLGSIDNFVARKALLLRADEVLKKSMERLEAQPAHLSVMVEVPLRMGEE
jgi:hypothetical protein